MDRLRALRKQYGLTMRELGKIIGVSESTISLYETGKREPDFNTLNKLASYFSVSVDYLLGRSESASSVNDGGDTMNRLRELRLQRGLTQAEFGRIFNASQNTVSNWEKGIRKIDNDHLIDFASFFSVSVDYLLGRTDHPAADPAEDKQTNKNQPAAVSGVELDEAIVSLLVDLSPSEVQRVLDFAQGLKASRKK